MTYFDWLRNKGCGCNNGCKDINPCSCDEILLEISNLHTDDQVLQDEIDSKQDELIEGNGIVIDENNVISVTGGTEGISSAQCQSMIDESISGKQDTLSAGSGININNNVISAKIWSGTIEQYNQISEKSPDCIYLIYNS